VLPFDEISAAFFLQCLHQTGSFASFRLYLGSSLVVCFRALSAFGQRNASSVIRAAYPKPIHKMKSTSMTGTAIEALRLGGVPSWSPPVNLLLG
jgi:hypothetical protein